MIAQLDLSTLLLRCIVELVFALKVLLALVDFVDGAALLVIHIQVLHIDLKGMSITQSES